MSDGRTLLVASEHAAGGLEAWAVNGAAHPRGRADLPFAFAFALHPRFPVAYVVTSQGSRIAKVELAGLDVLQEVETGVSLPCCVEVEADGSTLAVVHYEGAQVTLHELDASGSLASWRCLDLPAGSGPDADRQDRPHPHQARFRGGDLWVSDLGTDRLLRYPSGRGTPEVLPLRPGSGPRHFTWLDDGRVAVVDELSSSLSGYRLLPDGPSSAGFAALGARVPVRSYPSDLVCAGGFVYVANRVADTVTVVDAARGFQVVQEVAVGAWPQNLLLGHQELWCAIRDDHCVVRIPLGPTGRLGAAEPVLAVDRPVWIEWSPVKVREPVRDAFHEQQGSKQVVVRR